MTVQPDQSGQTEKYRPAPPERWGRDLDGEPGQIRVRTRWLYNETGSAECICCPGRHAFSRSGHVVASDWPSASAHMQDLSAHLHRALSAFGDDAEVIIEVRRADSQSGTGDVSDSATTGS